MFRFTGMRRFCARPPASSDFDLEYRRRDQLAIEPLILQRLRQQEMRRRALYQSRQHETENDYRKPGPDPSDQCQCDAASEYRQASRTTATGAR